MALVLSLTEKQRTALEKLLGSIEVPSMADPTELNSIYSKLMKARKNDEMVANLNTIALTTTSTVDTSGTGPADPNYDTNEDDWGV